MIKKSSPFLSFYIFLPLLIISFFTFNTVSAATCTNLSANIAIGSLDSHYSTPDVTKLQNFLVSQGLLTATPNGVFGLATQAAVKTFQTNNGLEVTGFAGALTRGKIKDISCGLNTASGVIVPASPVAIVQSPVLAPVTTVTQPQMSTCQFIDLLITIGVIPLDKVTPARLALGCVTNVVSSGGGGGGGGGSSSSATYRVTYNGNGKTSGSVPTDSTKYAKNSIVTVVGNTGSLVKTGYTFTGWNTKANGSGTARLASSAFTITSNVTLYAVWIVDPCSTEVSGFNSGDGLSTTTAYQICNWTQLNNIRNHLSSNYLLTANLSSSGIDYVGLGDSWVPIGYATTSFSGSFNGENKTISDLTITDLTEVNYKPSYLGLFGSTNNASISNIGVVNYSITGANASVGGLVGSQQGGSINNCYSIGNITGTSPASTEIGGLVGYTTGTISKSFSAGSVVGRGSVGGLVGAASSGTISDSYSSASVSAHTGVSSLSGGLVGSQGLGSLSNSYSIGSLIGYEIGGVVGFWHSTTTNSYWDIQTSGVGSSYGGTGTTTVGMKTPSTYVGWDIVAGAEDINNGYPYLGWQVGNDVDTWIMPGKTVTYDRNGGAGAVPTITAYFVGATTTVADVGPLTKTNWTFTSWNTQANGLGTDYATSSVLTVTDNITLYAQWRARITYDANGATGGAVPVDSTLYKPGATTTVANNTETLVKTNWIYSGWNTQADGLGTDYATSSVLTVTGNTTLYAKYIATVNYNSNSGNGSMPTQTIISGSFSNLNSNTFTKNGYVFAGWATSIDGAITYTDGSSYTVNSVDITLYAQWRFVVTYNGNGSTGGPVPTDSNFYLAGETTAVLDADSLVRTNAMFTGWNTAANGSGTAYAVPSTLTVNSNVTLYAQWLVWTDSQEGLNWNTASSTCAGLGLGRGSRLPTRSELGSALTNQNIDGGSSPGGFETYSFYWLDEPEWYGFYITFLGFNFGSGEIYTTRCVYMSN